MKEHFGHYIPFERKSATQKQNYNEFSSKFKCLFCQAKDEERVNETPYLYACYTGRDDNGADLDNVLLYNTGLKTNFFRGIILERNRESDGSGIDYEYDFQTKEEFYSCLNKRIVPDREYLIDTGFLDLKNEPAAEGGKVVHFYNLFRKWLCDSPTERIKDMGNNLQNKDFEMVIHYNGPSDFSESGFIKRIIDGVVSAMEAFNPKQGHRVIDGIDPIICPEVSVLNSENHYTLNGKGWNPQDHLLRRLVLIKGNPHDKSVRIMIRPL